MSTGAGVVACYLFWAAGYNTPNDVIVTFRREDLVPGKNAMLTDQIGRKKPLTEKYLQDILNRVARNEDGSYRLERIGQA